MYTTAAAMSWSTDYGHKDGHGQNDSQQYSNTMKAYTKGTIPRQYLFDTNYFQLCTYGSQKFSKIRVLKVNTVYLVSKCPEIGPHLWTFPIARIYLSKFKLYGSYRMNCDINDFELRSKVDSVINRLKANACIGSKNLMWKQQLNATLFAVSQDMVTRSINS